MRRFDCLAKDCPLLGPHLLEASAGTGKTFSIEHVYVRLILEKEPIEVEQILAVTFTRAATRELKMRIRANLEKALAQLQSGEIEWPYLEPLKNSKAATRALQDAIGNFDRCQIFTIHSFCHRMLSEFAFEAHLGLCLSSPDEPAQFPEALLLAVKDFLEWGVSRELVCPEQIASLFRIYGSLTEIGKQLLKEEKGGTARSFLQIFDECKAALHFEVDEEKLLADFRELAKNYKAQVKGDFEKQVLSLARWTKDKENSLHLRTLIAESGSLFAFLDAKNRKVRVVEPRFLHYPGFFDQIGAVLMPFLKPKPREILSILRSAWKPLEKKVAVDSLNPDEILKQMQAALREPLFLQRVQSKYQAAIIDEFQDTDPIQWEIFRTLSSSLKAFYLVGDPKQSIYRFRSADVYTYLSAKAFLGEENVYFLDTNFRSLPGLVQALNRLFERDWLALPKVGGFLPYLPVRAGVKEGVFDEDGKESVYFVKAEREFSLEKQLLPFALQEIERIAFPLDAFAVLIKDRYEAEKTVQFFQDRGLPAVARSHTLLGETLGFQVMKEFFRALLFLSDESAANIVAAGPLGEEVPFAQLREIVLTEGLSGCFQRLPQTSSWDSQLFSEWMQVVQGLFDWERQEGFSFEGLERAFQKISELEPAAPAHREAIQVMTMHVSKGLEFDIVFAWGLASQTPESLEEPAEVDAEKLRQLYVAMTRAKKRLYVPLLLNPEEPKPGTHSAIELFSRCLSKAEIEAFPGEHLPPILPAPFTTRSVTTPSSPRIFIPSILPQSPSSLLSFTALAQEQSQVLQAMEPVKDVYTLHNMPRGTDTGVAIHALFEKLFSSEKPLWKDSEALSRWIEKELFGSPLAPWKAAIETMVEQTLDHPLEVGEVLFSLRQLEPRDVQTEVEFLFASSPDFVKGFIDLVFYREGRYHFIDWKTNWLGLDASAYTKEALSQAMQAHDYSLQIRLYQQALALHLGHDRVGKAFYFFLRGNAVYA